MQEVMPVSAVLLHISRELTSEGALQDWPE